MKKKYKKIVLKEREGNKFFSDHEYFLVKHLAQILRERGEPVYIDKCKKCSKKDDEGRAFVVTITKEGEVTNYYCTNCGHRRRNKMKYFDYSELMPFFVSDYVEGWHEAIEEFRFKDAKKNLWKYCQSWEEEGEKQRKTHVKMLRFWLDKFAHAKYNMCGHKDNDYGKVYRAMCDIKNDHIFITFFEMMFGHLWD